MGETGSLDALGEFGSRINELIPRLRRYARALTGERTAADDLVQSGVNGYVVPAGSVEAFEAAMRDVAAWSQERRQLSMRRSAETIRRCSVKRGAEAFLRGAAIALQHRRSR